MKSIFAIALVCLVPAITSAQVGESRKSECGHEHSDPQKCKATGEEMMVSVTCKQSVDRQTIHCPRKDVVDVYVLAGTKDKAPVHPAKEVKTSPRHSETKEHKEPRSRHIYNYDQGPGGRQK